MNWPSGTDSRWGEYEEVVVGRLRDAQAGCLYQVRMEVHCTVVYEVGLEMFGLVEVKKGGRKEPFRSRRCRLIESLVAERRVVRAEREVGWEGRVREIASQLSKLISAERRRERDRDRKRQRGLCNSLLLDLL